MYEAHFGLREPPFRINADLRFHLDSPPERQALDALRQALDGGAEFIALLGPAGAGKSTVARQLCRSLDPERHDTAVLSTTPLEGDGILHMVAAAFSIELLAIHDPQARIVHWLHERAAQGRRVLLVVDEAHHLTPDALQWLQMLARVHVGGQAVLQVLLVSVALPQAVRDAAHEVMPLHVGAVVTLAPLEPAQTLRYVRHRLSQAGWSGRPTLDDEVLAAVHAAADGLPGRINLLCDRLLLHLYLAGRDEATPADVRAVTQGLQAELPTLAPGAGEATDGVDVDVDLGAPGDRRAPSTLVEDAQAGRRPRDATMPVIASNLPVPRGGHGIGVLPRVLRVEQTAAPAEPEAPGTVRRPPAALLGLSIAGAAVLVGLAAWWQLSRAPSAPSPQISGPVPASPEAATAPSPRPPPSQAPANAPATVAGPAAAPRPATTVTAAGATTTTSGTGVPASPRAPPDAAPALAGAAPTATRAATPAPAPAAPPSPRPPAEAAAGGRPCGPAEEAMGLCTRPDPAASPAAATAPAPVPGPACDARRSALGLCSPP